MGWHFLGYTLLHDASWSISVSLHCHQISRRKHLFETPCLSKPIGSVVTETPASPRPDTGIVESRCTSKHPPPHHGRRGGGGFLVHLVFPTRIFSCMVHLLELPVFDCPRNVSFLKLLSFQALVYLALYPRIYSFIWHGPTLSDSLTYGTHSTPA